MTITNKMKKIKPDINTPLVLGKPYTDCLTGQTGKCCIISINIAGQAEVALQPSVKPGGDYIDPTWHLWVNLTNAPQPAVPDYLGCELTEHNGGFVGVAIMALHHLSRCTQIVLQKQGIDPATKKPYETHTLDDMWVLPKEKLKKKKTKQKTGCFSVKTPRLGSH